MLRYIRIFKLFFLNFSCKILRPEFNLRPILINLFATMNITTGGSALMLRISNFCWTPPLDFKLVNFTTLRKFSHSFVLNPLEIYVFSSNLAFPRVPNDFYLTPWNLLLVSSTRRLTDFFFLKRPISFTCLISLIFRNI